MFLLLDHVARLAASAGATTICAPAASGQGSIAAVHIRDAQTGGSGH
ncbi:hypothetical protein [Streptomyces sp. NPDC001657]